MFRHIIYIFIFYFLLNNCSFNTGIYAQTGNNTLSKRQISKKQFAFKTLTINDGLSQNSVISMAQDSIGYLWLATQDGLNKYDGNHVKHYDKQFEDITRANYSKLGKVYIDKQNILWIITHTGILEHYQKETDSFKHIPLNFKASTLFQDHDRNLFIGSFNNGLFKICAKTKDTIQVLKSIDTTKTVNDIIKIKEDLYISTYGAVLKINSSGTYSKLLKRNQDSINFSALTSAKNGMYIGSYGHGLFFKPENSDAVLQVKNHKIPTNLNIEDLLIDKKNRLWIATYGNGVYLIDKNSVFNFKANKNNPFAIHYDDMLCLLEDNTGNIWFGSDGTGASYYDAHLIKFNILTNNQVPKSVNVDMVRAIATSENGETLWIGTSGKGLTRVNLKTDSYQTIKSENSGLSSDRIISLAQIDKDLWVGHQGYGLNIKQPKDLYISYPELQQLTIWKIIKAGNTQAWLCTENNGIILFDKNLGIIKQYNAQNSQLTTNHIKTLEIDHNDILWIASDNDGLFKLNPNTNSIIPIPQIPDKIKSIYVDNNIVWVGTNGNGLKAYNIQTKKVTVYDMADGLPNQVIYGMLPDEDGNLWLSTNNGISKFNLNSVPIHFENFSTADGLQAKEFNTGAYFKAPNGLLIFGGLEGINWFYPKQLSYNTIAPKTIISKFEVFSKPQNKTQNTTLAHHKNTVTFTFSALHFSQPKRNAYKYQLVNHDKDWITANHINMAHYTNLPPNTYTFKVISSNYDGVWNTNPATFTFTINKPWYLSTFALIIYGFLAIILAYIIYKYLKWRWNIKMQLQFEHEETERLKLLDVQKTKLYTNISHEFRTPLTLISGPIEKQLNNPKLSTEDKEDLMIANRSSNRLLDLVNQMLDLSKLEAGNLTLAVINEDLDLLLLQLIKAFQYKAKDQDIKFTYNISTIKQVWYDPEVFEKIVTNLLTNAIKYTSKQGEIIVTAEQLKGQLILKVSNTCNKVNRKEIQKWFNRYYQNDSSTEGAGIGLALVKELVTLNHGNISVVMKTENLIQFKISLPIKEQAFLPQEIKKKTEKAPLNGHSQRSLINLKPQINFNSNTLHLLIVEDDADIRLFISRLFKTEFSIHEASNGKQGLDLANKLIPDIIISDIMMPELDGISLCKTLKSEPKTSHIPIILLTAKSDTKNKIEGLQTGADDYIIKPFNTKVLQLKIANLIVLRQQLQRKYNSGTALLELANNDADQKFFSKINRVLQEHMINPEFSAQEFSKLMHMSRMQLHRKLKATAGQTTSAFIRLERLKMAKKLLKQTDSSISEIAYEVGFNSPSYFIKCFKKEFNCTPSDFQK